jgi:selenocysteine lyase/cysteine desulfurase
MMRGERQRPRSKAVPRKLSVTAMFAPVYLDHNASTPADPAVVEAMLPYLSQQFGNASSRHEYGRAARRAIDQARARSLRQSAHMRAKSCLPVAVRRPTTCF